MLAKPENEKDWNSRFAVPNDEVPDSTFLYGRFIWISVSSIDVFITSVIKMQKKLGNASLILGRTLYSHSDRTDRLNFNIDLINRSKKD